MLANSRGTDKGEPGWNRTVIGDLPVREDPFSPKALNAFRSG